MSIFLAALIKKYFPILRTSIISLILLGITGSISFLPGRSLTTRFSDEILVSSTLPKECDITAKFKGSAKHRLLIWRDLRRAIQDFSLFGVGLDGMLAIFPHYRSEETISTEGQYCRADRAHNEIFDVAASRGIPGLLIHLLLLNTTFLLLLRKIRRSKGEERNYSLALLAAFFGFFVQNLFSFQMIATATIWWALLGVTYNLTSKDWINKPQPLKWVPRYFPFLILPLFILPILPYIADIHYCNAEKLAAVGNLDLAIQEYRRAATLYPGEYKYYPSLAKSCLDKVIREPNLSKEEKEALLEEAKKVIKRALAVAKEDAIMLNLLGMVYYLEGNLDKAALYYKKALKIEPYLADAHNNLGVVYANLKDYKRAEKEFRKAVEFDKEYVNNLNNLLKLKANKLNSS
jgi:tetratricopeptide (TPR) repeat protein